MAYQMAPTPVTLNDLKGHSPLAGLFKCNFSTICAVFHKILMTKTASSRGPSATAGLLVDIVRVFYSAKQRLLKYGWGITPVSEGQEIPASGGQVVAVVSNGTVKAKKVPCNSRLRNIVVASFLTALKKINLCRTAKQQRPFDFDGQQHQLIKWQYFSFRIFLNGCVKRIRSDQKQTLITKKN